ncbi:ABC transporter permease [Nocardia sp. N13]|uniref:ABC transporter permease n=1 Tax=Nocardioides sp. N13(2025) TaxID=3453405 RepID=UPI003F7677D5
MSATVGTTGARIAPRPAMATYALLDLRRQLRDRFGMFFVVGLPTFMYLVFGLGSDDPVGSGNVAMYVMVSMAAYGAVNATTSVAGSAATEQVMGWGRQLGLTPVRPLGFVVAKAAVAMAVAAVPVALVFALGAVTGARGDWTDWTLAAAIVWLGSALFAIYGLAVCLVLRGTNAPGIASGMIVVMAFLGNVFSPIDGLLLDIGRLTPLYGYAALARFPLTDGRLPVGGQDPLWLPVANVLAWTVIFSLLAVWGVRRSRART